MNRTVAYDHADHLGTARWRTDATGFPVVPAACRAGLGGDIVRVMAALRFLDDAGRIQTRTLDSEHFVIGRAPSCDLIFDSEMISREHLRFDVAGDGRFRIRDLGSRNRTLVNGEQITETLLSPGDIIRAGDRVLEFLDDAATAERIDLDFLAPQKTEPPDCEWLKLKSSASLTVTQIEQLSQLVGEQPLMSRPEDIAGTALSCILHDLQADRGFIALRGDGKNELHPLAHRALKRSAGGPFTAVSHAFAVAPLTQLAAGRYPHTAAQLDDKLGYAITAVVAPLTCRGEAIGILYVDRPASRKPFAAAAMHYCLAAGATLGASLSESGRRLSRAAVREGAAWMAAIRRMQTMLTRPPPRHDSFDCEIKMFPGRVRCGDFATLLPVDRQRCIVVIMDGGGHGMTGIAQSHAVQTAIAAAASARANAMLDPADLFNTINAMIAESPARQVLPCIYVAIDAAAGKLAYVNAGGVCPLLVSAPGVVHSLDQTSLVLGVDAAHSYSAKQMELPDAFRLVFLTDGLTEAVNAGGETLGEVRVRDALSGMEGFPSTVAMVSKIAETWSSHMGVSAGDDDATVMVVGYGRMME